MVERRKYCVEKKFAVYKGRVVEWKKTRRGNSDPLPTGFFSYKETHGQTGYVDYRGDTMEFSPLTEELEKQGYIKLIKKDYYDAFSNW